MLLLYLIVAVCVLLVLANTENEVKGTEAICLFIFLLPLAVVTGAVAGALAGSVFAVMAGIKSISD